MTTRIDALGSVVGRYRGRDAGPLTLILGSHIDTVRDAGRFDGALGVIVAIEVVKAAFKSGKRFPFAIEVVAFGDEEGVRFASTLGGSKALAGRFDFKALDETGDDGVSRRQALKAFGTNPSRVSEEALSPDQALGYVEVHIEQGPVLEQEGLPVGIVTAIDGVTRGTVEVDGVAGHAGTVPMPMRKDALAAAAEMMLAIEARVRSQSNLVATVGKIEVPGSAANTIPGRVRFTLDIRSPSDQERINAVGDIKNAIAAIAQRRGVTAELAVGHEVPAAICDRGFQISWRKWSKLWGSSRGGCRAAPATTPWRSTRSFRSLCCLYAAAAASATTRQSLHRPTISTSPRACFRLFSMGSHHHDHAAHQGRAVRLRGRDGGSAGAENLREIS